MKIIRFFATFHHWLSKKIVLTFIHCHLYANRTFDTDEHAIPSSPACSGLHTKFHPHHRAAQCATTIRSALTLRTLINELAVFRMILLTVSHSVMWNRYCHALFTVHLQVVYSYSSHRHIGRNNDDILPLHSNQKPIFCHYFELTEHAPFIMKPVIQAQMLIAQYWASIVDFLFCNCLSPRHCNLIDSSPLFTYVTNSTPIFCCCCCCSVCCCVLYVVCSYSPDAEYMQRYTLSPWQWLMLLLLPDCFALSFCLCYVQTGFVGTVFFFWRWHTLSLCRFSTTASAQFSIGKMCLCVTYHYRLVSAMPERPSAGTTECMLFMNRLAYAHACQPHTHTHSQQVHFAP